MTATFYVGDAIEVMGKLPEKSVDLVISSPPFLALRSYLPQDHPDKPLEGGSQATPGEYVDWLLDVVEACARVLAPHGSLCFELGDTYSGSGGAGGDYNDGSLRDGQPKFDGSAKFARHEGRNEWEAAHPISRVSGTRGAPGGHGWALPKSLTLIPESFRWAMVYGHNPFTGRRTEPWRLRNVIRWVRPNPPVGALGDKFRPATSELMVFCKTKDRYFDLDAVREPATSGRTGEIKDTTSDWGGFRGVTEGGKRGVVTVSHPSGAPPLDWWNIPPGGYPGAHYAVWPPELLVKPIKAMCPEQVCRTCGEARRRIVEPTEEYAAVRGVRGFKPDERRGNDSHLASELRSGGRGGPTAQNTTLGFSDCGCSCWTCDGRGTFTKAGASEREFLEGTAEIPCSSCEGSGLHGWRPGLVLDPFAGSGTTLAVATGHGRDAIGIDLDERNYDLALDRVGPLILERAS